MILENNGRKIIIGKNVPETQQYKKEQETEKTPRELLYTICKTIEEGGYNPISQLVGYVISEDPTHISNYQNARTLMSKIDRDEMLEDMVRSYIDTLKREFEEKEAQKNDD
jgi:uncharacterized protein (UPF0297 family)